MGLLSDITGQLFGGSGKNFGFDNSSASNTQSLQQSSTDTTNTNIEDTAGTVIAGDTSGDISITTSDQGAIDAAAAIADDAFSITNDALAVNESVTINAQDTVSDLAANAIGTVADSITDVTDSAFALVDNSNDRLLSGLETFVDGLLVSSDHALERVSSAVADVNDLTANVVAPDAQQQQRMLYLTAGVLAVAGLAIVLRR